MVSSITDQINISKYFPEKKDSPKYQDTTTVVPDKNKALPFEGGHSTKNGSMCHLKHEIS